MKNSILFTTLFMFLMVGSTFAQTQTAQFYNVKSGQHGNGVRFWNSDYYKIHMGNLDEYHYGPVTNYSIKFNMNNASTRGWTWGVAGQTPTAALNTQGHFQIAGWMKSMNRAYYFGDIQRLYGDNASALFWRNNHNTVTQFILQDKQGTNYGRLYGGSNGATFGLLDGDGNWSYLAAKDDYTAFRINNNEKMRITSTGNVGIGTTNPTHKLTVEAGNGGGLLINSSHGNTHIPWTDGKTYLSGKELIFRTTGNVNRMRIASNGNVGIGIDIPLYELQVGGSARFNSVLIGTDLGGTTAGYADHVAGVYNLHLRASKTNNTGGLIIFDSGTSEKMRLNTSGQLLINTTSAPAAYKLAVNGSVRTKEVVVESGWSDYVFYDDYQLPTLEEEEKHIEDNGHLLGFESEEDMVGEIQLGDVSKRQQAKIEEMMLHLIEMKKEIKQLKEENEQQKKEVNK